MSENLKVLSIDWDYFIDASMLERSMMFPDGGNESLSDAIADFVWATRYAGQPKLEKIGIDIIAFSDVKKRMKKWLLPSTKVMAADSHRHIYQFITSNLKHGQKVELYNIDFHHDAYGIIDSEVNCGNWLNHLSKAIVNPVHWVCRVDSDDEQHDPNVENVKTNLADVPDKPFDLIFLCRSSCWSPPHLDKHFMFLMRSVDRLSGQSQQTVDSLRELHRIRVSRYSKAMKDNIEATKIDNLRAMDTFTAMVAEKNKNNEKGNTTDEG